MPVRHTKKWKRWWRWWRRRRRRRRINQLFICNYCWEGVVLSKTVVVTLLVLMVVILSRQIFHTLVCMLCRHTHKCGFGFRRCCFILLCAHQKQNERTTTATTTTITFERRYHENDPSHWFIFTIISLHQFCSSQEEEEEGEEVSDSARRAKEQTNTDNIECIWQLNLHKNLFAEGWYSIIVLLNDDFVYLSVFAYIVIAFFYPMMLLFLFSSHNT